MVTEAATRRLGVGACPLHPPTPPPPSTTYDIMSPVLYCCTAVQVLYADQLPQYHRELLNSYDEDGAAKLSAVVDDGYIVQVRVCVRHRLSDEGSLYCSVWTLHVASHLTSVLGAVCPVPPCLQNISHRLLCSASSTPLFSEYIPPPVVLCHPPLVLRIFPIACCALPPPPPWFSEYIPPPAVW